MMDSQLTAAWLRAFAPPPKVAPSDFAESEIFLPGSSNAEPGPLRLAVYQRELVDSVVAEDAEIIVMMLSSQTGKSLSIDAMLAYGIACAPGPMLHVSPTGARSEDFVRDRFDPLVSASPALRALIGKGQDKRKGRAGGANSLASKSFPGGQLAFASSHKPDQLAARAIRLLVLDEIDRFAPSAGVEGDPIALAIKRTKTFEGRGRKIVLVSTPTSSVGSRINKWFERGDQRRFAVECPDCAHRAPFAFENLKWDEGKPETAYLSCEACGAVHDEAQRRAMIECGRWEPTAKGESGIRSYHLNELASKFSTLESVAQAAEAAKDPTQKQAFYNTTLAQVYDASSEVELSSTELQQRAEPIAAPYAANIQFVTAGVDVQSDRVECTFLGHHGDDTASVLNHLRLEGDTSGNAVWTALDTALGATFVCHGGKRLIVSATAVDSGFNADQVLTFVTAQRRKSRACYAVKGVTGFDRQSLRWGGKLKGQMKLLLVGVDAVKLTIQKRLALQTVEPGFIRLPNHLGPEYFQGLASEQLHVRYVRGAPRHEYRRVVRANEPLDCLVYASAITGVVNVKALTTPAKPQESIAQLAAKLNAAHNS
jgi:phage terminase large subunit GpA-like protein